MWFQDLYKQRHRNSGNKIGMPRQHWCGDAIENATGLLSPFRRTTGFHASGHTQRVAYFYQEWWGSRAAVEHNRQTSYLYDVCLMEAVQARHGCCQQERGSQ